MNQPKKAKRVLKNIDFSGQDAHISFVGPDVGGPANLQDYALVMKSTAHFSEEIIEKAQRISVEMELPEFLRTVFDMYWEDSEVLARLMGYVPEEENDEADYMCRDYIAERLESFTVLKALHESQNLVEELSKLDGNTYLSMLQDQERVEKALKNKASLDSEAVVEKATAKQPVVAEPKKPKARIVTKAKVSEQGHKAEPVDKAGIDAKADKAEPKKTEVSKMTVKTVEVEKTEQIEMVEKSQYESIAKALEEQRVELEKASALIAQFQEEKKVAVAKARKAELVAAVSEEDKAEQLFKAVGELADEAFQAVVEVVKALSAKAEADPMFVEKGAASEEAAVEEDELTKLLKAKHRK